MHGCVGGREQRVTRLVFRRSRKSVLSSPRRTRRTLVPFIEAGLTKRLRSRIRSPPDLGQPGSGLRYSPRLAAGTLLPVEIQTPWPARRDQIGRASCRERV